MMPVMMTVMMIMVMMMAMTVMMMVMMMCDDDDGVDADDLGLRVCVVHIILYAILSPALEIQS